MQVRTFLLVGLVLLVGCENTSQIYVPYKDTKKGLLAEQLVGVWMIDDASLQYIKKVLGYRIYINTSDHVLLLNDDFSCAYKGFIVYKKASWTWTEHDESNGMENACYSSDVELIHDRFCWCESLLDFPFLKGPYSQKPCVTNDVARMFRKTLWTTWTLTKRTEKINYEDYTQFHDWLYKICLFRPEVQGEHYYGDSVNLYVGLDNMGLYLLVSAIVDDNPLLYGVKFRKLNTGSLNRTDPGNGPGVAHPRAGVKRQISSAPAFFSGYFLFWRQRGRNLTLDN